MFTSTSTETESDCERSFVQKITDSFLDVLGSGIKRRKEENFCEDSKNDNSTENTIADVDSVVISENNEAESVVADCEREIFDLKLQNKKLQDKYKLEHSIVEEYEKVINKNSLSRNKNIKMDYLKLSDTLVKYKGYLQGMLSETEKCKAEYTDKIEKLTAERDKLQEEKIQIEKQLEKVLSSVEELSCENFELKSNMKTKCEEIVELCGIVTFFHGNFDK